MVEKNVVVIDPDQQWARELGDAFQEHSRFGVLTPVHNGKAALDCILEHRPDMIILELLLDDYDGLYLLNHIHDCMDGYRPLVYILSALPVQHLALFIQAIAGLWGQIYVARKPQLPRCVIGNTCHLLQLPPDPIQPVDQTIDEQIDAFLFKLSHRFHLKCYTAARAALKLMFLEGDRLDTMTSIYIRVAEQAGGTKSQIERNLRSYRESLKKTNTDFYHTNLAQYNTTNADFYWNALRLFKQETR